MASSVPLRQLLFRLGGNLNLKHAGSFCKRAQNKQLNQLSKILTNASTLAGSKKIVL